MKDDASCWTCLGKIHKLLSPMHEKLDDYISSPKENLYMSLRTTLLMEGLPVEVFIKTVEMDWVAELGVGAHWRHSEELQQTDMGRKLREANKWLSTSLKAKPGVGGNGAGVRLGNFDSK